MNNEAEKKQAAEIAAKLKAGNQSHEDLNALLRENRELREQLFYLIDDDAVLAGEVFRQKIQHGHGRGSLRDRAVSTLDILARQAIVERIAKESGGTADNDSTYGFRYVRLSQGDVSVAAEVKFMKVDDWKVDELRRIQVNVDSIRYGIRDQIFRDSKKGLDFAAIATALKEQLEQRVQRNTNFKETEKKRAEMEAFVEDLNTRFDTDGFSVRVSTDYGVEAKLTFSTSDKAAFEAMVAKLMPVKKTEAATT